ncbi:PLP-dependent aminotransferase family protein [Paenirhodobacter sp.]|uniref:MocR-like pyridoxine biosynthesis transcription factor PdxR n=1 Tax=Paenirhodobacter sp. TaxID=1965326 RepID=UPI003B3EFC70
MAQDRPMGARQICEVLRDQILGGVFGADGRLPSSRTLAQELGVSRTTVTVAYEQLLAEGYIEVRQGARPRVTVAGRAERAIKVAPVGARPLSAYGERIRAFSAPTRSDHKLIADFRYGDLAPSDFPSVLWKRAVNAALAHRGDRLAYDDPRGSYRLRAALQGYLWRARRLRCALDQIIIVNGSQQGLDLCARLLLDPGDRFAIENPCYAMARGVFASTGAMSLPLPVDRDGLVAEALAHVRARLAYVTPSHQFPLGGVLPVSRRHQLLAWARGQGAWVVEDDYDSEYRYDITPVPPLYGLDDSGRVIYLGTISKTLSPSLRIGYLVVPPDLRQVFATAKHLADRHAPLTEQEALAALIESGAYERHVRRARRLNGERRMTLLNALRGCFGDGAAIEGADAGLHLVLWLDLPPSCEAPLVAEAGRAGVGIYPISPLYDPQAGTLPDRVGLVMGYAALDARRIERGVQLLAEAVSRVRPAISTKPRPGFPGTAPALAPATRWN